MVESPNGHKSLYYDDNKDEDSNFCRSCCLWLTFLIGLILIIGIITGAVYYAFLQSNLPESHLHRLDISKLNLTNNAEHDVFLISDMLFYLNMTNKSGRLELVYGPMTVYISSMGVTFPEVALDSMRQSPHNQTDLNVRSATKKLVEESAGQQLQDAANRHMMVINFVVKGWMDIYKEGKKLQGFPYKIDCHSIDQMDIDLGLAPACNAKISLLQ